MTQATNAAPALPHAGPPSGLPLWRHITHALTAELRTMPPGARLPTEAAAAARFGVNRHTVRRALEELARAGLIRVEQGRGAFVAEDVMDYAVEPRTRFSEWVRRHNKEPSGQVLDLREAVADLHVARALGVRVGAKLAVLERLGLADDVPVALGTHHFPLARLPGLLAAFRGTDSVTSALRAVGIEDYRRQVTRVSARLPSPTEARLLRTPRNRPLLVCENVNVDRDGRIVEFGVARHPTPRVQIMFEP